MNIVGLPWDQLLTLWQRGDLARVEELAQRAHKAEAAGFHLQSHPGSPGPGSARSAHSRRSERSSQQHYRNLVQSPRSPDPNAPVNAEWYDENGQLRAQPGGAGGGNDPFSDRQSVSTTGTDARSSHVIPIKYLPRQPSDEGLAKHLGNGGTGTGARPPADAARALDEARANLFKNGKVPARPARSPDLDLRLNPSAQQQLNPPSSFLDTLRTPGGGAAGSSRSRDSYLSGNSGAPSYLSGSTDYIHLDAPKIVTSRQIQVGRLHQAEMVQLGRPLNQNMENLNQSNTNANPIQSSPSTPTSQTNPFHGGSSDENHQNTGRPPLSPATFGSRTLGYDISDAASASTSYRTLTPVPSYQTTGAEEDVQLRAGSSHDYGHDGGDTPTTGDLRFSMGTFSRDSISTVGTGRYLDQATPFSRPYGTSDPRYPGGARESMSSDRSGVDSVLHGFPMIPPHQPLIQTSGGQRSPIPQSTSVTTLEHAAMPSRPPTTYKTPAPATPTATQGSGSGSGSGSGGNRETQGSVGLGNFPFVPPPSTSEQPTAGLPIGATDGPPTLPHITKGRNTIGMSTTSEGLGGFEFSFDGQPPLPDQRS